MIVELQNSHPSIIHQGIYLPYIPRWGLRELSLIIGPYHSGQEHEQHFLETIGSGNWYRSEFDEYRFTMNDYLLTSIWFHIPEVNLKSNDTIQSWLLEPSIKGLIRISKVNVSNPEPMDIRYFDKKGAFLVCFNKIALKDHQYRLKLNIAKDFYLLFAEKRLCGWLLTNPVDYLTIDWNEPSNHNEIFDYHEISQLLHEYLQLISETFIEKIEDEDPVIGQKILTLRKRIIDSHGSQHHQIIINCIDDIWEQFYS